MNSRKTIYFDHQATTPVDERVLQKILPYFAQKAGNPHSADHCIGWESSRAVREAAEQVAALIGADADEIIFTSGATEANNLALLGLAGRASNRARRRVLVSEIEHKSVFGATRALEDQFGLKVEYVPVDREGSVSARALEDRLDDSVLAVSIMAVNNEIGTIQDIEGISAAARQAGALFHSDAAQAPYAIDMGELARHVDFLSLSAHKMYGPQGIGALYVRRDLQSRIEPLIHGGGQQNGLRSGTLPVPLCVGMGEAAALHRPINLASSRLRLISLRDKFVDKLTGLPWPISVNGPPPARRHPGNANIRFHGFDAHEILSALQPRLAASTGSACTSGIPAPSHVLKAIGLSSEEADSSIRFSLGLMTRDVDIDAAVELIAAALKRLSEPTIAHST